MWFSQIFRILSNWRATLTKRATIAQFRKREKTTVVLYFHFWHIVYYTIIDVFNQPQIHPNEQLHPTKTGHIYAYTREKGSEILLSEHFCDK